MSHQVVIEQAACKTFTANDQRVGKNESGNDSMVEIINHEAKTTQEVNGNKGELRESLNRNREADEAMKPRCIDSEEYRGEEETQWSKGGIQKVRAGAEANTKAERGGGKSRGGRRPMKLRCDIQMKAEIMQF